jgi:hypothetical protein
LEEQLKFHTMEGAHLVFFKTNLLAGNNEEEDSILHQINPERVRSSPKNGTE